MNIIIISGSVRSGRKSHNVALELQKRFINTGYHDTHVLDLAEYSLPVLEEKYSDEHEMPKGLYEMQIQLYKADALIFLSPEYHGSYTGAFKNAIDYFWKEFAKKPIGVVAVASGRMGGINASSDMQQLILSLGGYPMPYKLLVSSVQNAFDESGNIKDDFLSQNMERFVKEFVWLAEAIVEKKQKNTN